MSWTVWITGLPGSGKSTIARELAKKVKKIQILRLDEIRRQIIPEPKYTQAEREYVYKALIEEAVKRVSVGNNLIIDATAHKKAWRDLARNLMKDLIEVYVKCDLETCIKRESRRPEGLVMAEIYKKALDRKETGREYEGLGEVVGIDVPYEENKAAEIIIESDKIPPAEAAGIIFDQLKKKGWVK